MKGIRKFLILTLSLFMMFSSCLMISAEDELTLSAMQDESGDLVLSITGNDAETYISLINEGKTNISALFTIEDITKSARITNKYEKNIIPKQLFKTKIHRNKRLNNLHKHITNKQFQFYIFLENR